MHLIARRDHVVEVAGVRIDFREGESIHTENSYKHTSQALVRIAGLAGWEVDRMWTDDAGLFGIVRLEPDRLRLTRHAD